MEYNSVLKILENPVRRKIIERLSREPVHPLQMAKDLGLGQQLVSKHLKIMEQSGMIRYSIEKSPSGPERRKYYLDKSLSVTLDVAPHLFKEKLVSLDIEPEDCQISKFSAAIIEKKGRIVGYSEGTDKVKLLSDVLADIDEKLDKIEKERTVLLSTRNIVMKEASKIITKIDDEECRIILHKAVYEHLDNAKRISEELNLREDTVKRIINKLKKDLKTNYFNFTGPKKRSKIGGAKDDEQL